MGVSGRLSNEQILIERRTPGDSGSLFRFRLDNKVIGENLTAVQTHLLIGEILDRISRPMSDRINQELWAYFRQLCCSRKPKTSRAFRLDIGASNPSSSRAIGVNGACLARNDVAGSFAIILSFDALNTWKPSPSFSRQRLTIWARSRTSI